MSYPPHRSCRRPGDHSDPWQPALAELRKLPVPALDRLVRAWLHRLGACAARPSGRCPGARTYHVLFTATPVPTPMRVRVHQRRNRLQPQHVEAFAGHLTRIGVAAGLLVTTGEISREAASVAAGFVMPRIRLYSGLDWASELVRCRPGLRLRSVWRYLLDLGGRGETDRCSRQPGGRR
ncbi:MAG: restriction endonuclease [Armatimonadota bacterium]